MGDRSNIQVAPRNVYWGSQAVWSVAFTADTAGSLNSDWFSFEDGIGTKYYVWFNINSAGVDPAVSGRTGIEVEGATGATAATLVAAAIAAINAVSGIAVVASSVVSGTLLLTNTDMGAGVIPANGTSSPSFTYASVTAGTELDLGFIDGDIELALGPEEAVEVKAHQTGSNIIERITTGRVIEAIALALKETDETKLKALMSVAGDTYTPSGGAEVYGLGMSEDFTSQSSRSKMLLLHPANVARSVRTKDILFWLAFPQVATRTMSGEAEEMANVEFGILPDFDKASEVRYCVVGDHAQDFAE